MASADLFKAGYVINDRFEIKRLLGQGGFAMVFEGTDRNLDRQVAIKILHGAVLASSEEDGRVIERFEREAKLAASVDHPSVVNIYDAGEINELGEPFIVMEYLKGDSLQDYLDERGPIEPAKLLPLFKDVLMGLGYAHELGIVHKDLKPDNIFYRYPGTMRESLCIVDFGIAHIGRSNSGRVTRDGEFFGTPAYMPPEYISEQKVSAGFDVYQMGLILIECLTGQAVVHHEDAVATLLMHLNRQFKIPEILLQSKAWPVIERAIAANPSTRYDNALGFAEALHSLPDSAWPTLAQLSSVPVDSDSSNKSTVNGSLDEESEGEEIADLWSQEDSYRTTHNVGSTVASHSAQHSADLAPLQEIDSTEEVAYTSDSPQRSSKLGLIALLVALLIILAIGAIALLSADKKTPDDAVTPPEEVKVDAVASAVKTPPQEVEPQKEPDVPKDPPAVKAPEPINVVISGTPKGALITDKAGKILGKAPYELALESKESAGQLITVSHRGYEPADFEVTPALAKSGMAFTLKKLKRKTTKKKPAEVKPPTTTPQETTKKVELPGGVKKKKNPPSSGILLPK